MKIALVDDRPDDRQRLIDALESYASLNSLHPDLIPFSSGEALMEGFHAHQYAVIFLDVFLDSGMSGVETARQIREIDEDVTLIFLTSSDEHQAEAIHFHVFDYLSKENLSQNVFRTMDRILRKQTSLSVASLSFVSGKTTVQLPYQELVYLTADRNYLIIHDSKGNEYRTRSTFSSVWETLHRDDRFLPVLRGVIVNMDYLTDISHGVCVLRGDIRVPVSVRNSASLEEIWTNYTFARIRRESLEGGEAL